MTGTDTDDKLSYNEYDRRSGQPTTPKMTVPYKHLLDAITTLPSPIQTNNPRLLEAQAPTFRETKNTLNEFEHFLRNHLRPMSKRLTKEAKLQYFQSLLREETVEFHQSLTIITESTLNNVLTIFRKECTKNDLNEITRYLRDEAEHNPTAKTFSDLLKRLKNFAKQMFLDNAREYTQTFLFGKLPISIQQEIIFTLKEDATTEELEALLHK